MNKFKGVFCTRQIRRLTALLIVLAMLFAAVFVVAYAHHDCSGEDCRICEQVQICLQSFKFLAVAVAAIALWIFAFAFHKLIVSGAGNCFLQTPITLKVKLNN